MCYEATRGLEPRAGVGIGVGFFVLFRGGGGAVFVFCVWIGSIYEGNDYHRFLRNYVVRKDRSPTGGRGKNVRYYAGCTIFIPKIKVFLFLFGSYY